jgi:SPP1 gp7 family putative phage head morphogenesis protein
MARKDISKNQNPKKQPGGAPDPIVIQNIEVRPYNRTQQDIPNWRKAIQSAESQIPRRNLLYNLYADVELDGHVESVTGKRKDAVKDANWQFVDKDGTPVDEVNDLIDSVGFDNVLDEIINALFWGYTILEPRFWINDEGKWEVTDGLIPRLNYRPEIGKVAYDIYGDDGINIREGIYAKTIMEVGKVKDLGLYMKAAPYQVLKRGGLGDYAAFIQTFGNPLIDATWDGFDEKQRLKLKTALDNIGPGGVIIRPDGTTIDIKENNVKDTGDSHGAFLSFLNKEISKALLGTTETTESSTSSGYAQSETHSDQDERKHSNDITWVRKVLNSRFIPLMRAAGIDTKGGRFIIQGEDNELSQTEAFNIHLQLADKVGLPIDHDFWYETYGIPKPENYNEIIKEKEQAKPPVNPENEDDPEEEPDDIELSDNEDVIVQELESRVEKFINRLLGFFGKAPAVTTGADQACGCHHIIKLADKDRYQDDALLQSIWKKQGKQRFDADLYFHTTDVLIKAFKEGWQAKKKEIKLAAPGFVYDWDDPALLMAFEQNLFRFSGAKTLAMVQDLNELFRATNSYEEFYAQASKVTEVFNKQWLETEYNSAVLTGEAAATYYRLLAQKDTFPYWKYKTVGDHLVRPEHRLIDGIVLPYNDKRWKKIFPPNGWNCRCYIVPRLRNEVSAADIKRSRKIADSYINSTQFKKEKAQGWGVNRAELGQVFTANQQYVRKFPGNASRDLRKLGYANYGLPSYSNAKKAASVTLPEFTGEASTFFKGLQGQGNSRTITDYHKRPLTVTEAAILQEKRIQYLEALQQGLNNPDEVWINGHDFSNLVYIKYYQGNTIVTVAKIVNGQLQLKDWFSLAEKKAVISKYRSGLLIRKP